MTQKVIVHVARDHGSKGSVIAEKLAEVLNCKVYDDSIIDDIAKQHDLDPEVLKNYDEKPRRSILYRLSQGGGSDLPEKMMEYMFEYFQKIAATEDRAVIVGRCAGEALENVDYNVNVFVTAKTAFRIQNVMDAFDLSFDEARLRIDEVDKARQRFHETYSTSRWQTFENYDLIINTTDIGIDGAVKMILEYLELRFPGEPEEEPYD
ncbi:MAG: cytidylate kinase-like family protein [Clostridia bacterium]|nr:cytidylate kinase-like family protein [Clostridia bacterium]MBQ3995722.1 cytidylate kinase-like family protein [Clostridia bacterium]MBQ5480622.1 cytidylate kinase-like family protein [Clostridia bacterium]MBQ5684835.1 cytidylate kinase-like family protein [Clostridia bacterium]